jgi:hypothetical protein
MHRNHPQAVTTTCVVTSSHWSSNVTEEWSLEILCFPQHIQFDPGRPPRADRSHDHHGIHPGQIVHRASEPSPSNRWGAALANNSPGQTSRLNNGMSTRPKGQISITRAQRRTRT